MVSLHPTCNAFRTADHQEHFNLEIQSAQLACGDHVLHVEPRDQVQEAISIIQLAHGSVKPQVSSTDAGMVSHSTPQIPNL